MWVQTLTHTVGERYKNPAKSFFRGILALHCPWPFPLILSLMSIQFTPRDAVLFTIWFLISFVSLCSLFSFVLQKAAPPPSCPAVCRMIGRVQRGLCYKMALKCHFVVSGMNAAPQWQTNCYSICVQRLKVIESLDVILWWVTWFFPSISLINYSTYRILCFLLTSTWVLSS